MDFGPMIASGCKTSNRAERDVIASRAKSMASRQSIPESTPSEDMGAARQSHQPGHPVLQAVSPTTCRGCDNLSRVNPPRVRSARSPTPF